MSSLLLECSKPAIASFDQAIQIKSGSPEISWYNRGITLVKLECLEEAITSFDKTIQIQPDFHQAWYNKASCYALQLNVKQALENLQQAINLNPDTYRNLAKTDSDFDSIREDARFQALIHHEIELQQGETKILQNINM